MTNEEITTLLEDAKRITKVARLQNEELTRIRREMLQLVRNETLDAAVNDKILEIVNASINRSRLVTQLL